MYQYLQTLTKSDEYVLTVETAGSLEPRQIIIAGIEELSKRLEEFKENLTELERIVILLYLGYERAIIYWLIK